jgi:tRNA A-37 threonylcarbamoyl transferase component Bud32/tetratricopeptide (TPR) repeat protein
MGGNWRRSVAIMISPQPAESNDASSETLRDLQFSIDHPSLDDFNVSELPRARAETQWDIDACWQLLGRGNSGGGCASTQACVRENQTETSSQRRYQAEDVIGVGAFGVVFKARDSKLSRDVALKILRPSIKLSRRARSRFSLESQMLARCGFDGIISIFEVGELNEHPYMAMGLIDGPNLADYLADRPELLPHKTSARLVQQIAEAIHRAHQAKILHRDLKPSNVLLAHCDNAADRQFPFRPVVSDFRLAKYFSPLLEKQEDDHSVDAAIVGTVRYMSPEQAAGHSSEVCEASDVFSLGVMLFELLTGSCPFGGRSRIDVLHAITQQTTPSPRKLNKLVPRELEAIVLKSMAKDRSQRYASAMDFAVDLEAWLSGKPTVARPAGKLKRFGLWTRRNPALASLLCLMAIGVLGGCWVFSELYQRAHRNLELALQAKRSLMRFAEETLQNVPNANQKKLELHLEALRLSEDYAEQNNFDDSSLYGLSVAHHYVGLAAINAEQFELGIENLKQCIAMVERLSERQPNNAKFHFDLFTNQYHLDVNYGSLFGESMTEPALQHLNRAVALDPTNIDYQDALAASNRTIGFRMGGNRGRQLLQDAIAVSRTLATTHPERPMFWKHAVGAATELAAIENNEGNFEKALWYLEDAIEYDASYRDDSIASKLSCQITLLQEKVDALEGLKDPAAIEAIEECVGVCQQIEVIDTKYLYCRLVRGGLHVRAAQFLWERRDLESSQRQLQQAIDVLDEYQPTLPAYEAELSELRTEIDQLSSTIGVAFDVGSEARQFDN